MVSFAHVGHKGVSVLTLEFKFLVVLLKEDRSIETAGLLNEDQGRKTADQRRQRQQTMNEDGEKSNKHITVSLCVRCLKDWLDKRLQCVSVCVCVWIYN